eukprot:Em0005g1050a
MNDQSLKLSYDETFVANDANNCYFKLSTVEYITAGKHSIAAALVCTWKAKDSSNNRQLWYKGKPRDDGRFAIYVDYDRKMYLEKNDAQFTLSPISDGKEPSRQWENAEDGSLKIDDWRFKLGISGQDPNVISIVNANEEYLTVDFTISTTEDKSSHCSEWYFEPSENDGCCVIYDHKHANNNRKLRYDVTNKTVILSDSAQDNTIPFVRTKNKQKLPTKKHFLYEIVASKYNEIDVDKWDYFTRDCHSLGLKHGFDQTRLLNSARVMKRKKADLPWEAKDYHIAYRDAAKQDLIGMFYTRAQLHKRACQHKVSYAIEMMLSESFTNLDAYMTLTDNILEKIRLWGRKPQQDLNAAEKERISQFQVAIKWWLGLDTSGGSLCSLCPDTVLDPLGHHASTCKRGGDAVFRHNRLRDVVAESCRLAHLSVKVEAGYNLTPDHSHTRPADVLVQNWSRGRSAAFDICVTSPLNTLTLSEAGVCAGAAAQAGEVRKHSANDDKCGDLGWFCVPLVTETYGAWGAEAKACFSQLASRLSIRLQKPKSVILYELYGRLNTCLVRCVATAILSNFVGKRLSHDEKYDALMRVTVPRETHEFPVVSYETNQGTKRRSFQHSWLSKYPGLAYSISQDGAYCIYCVLFDCSPSEHDGVLVSKPFKDWKHATECFNGHFLNIKCDSEASYGYETHKKCAESALSLQRVKQCTKLLEKITTRKLYKCCYDKPDTSTHRNKVEECYGKCDENQKSAIAVEEIKILRKLKPWNVLIYEKGESKKCTSLARAYKSEADSITSSIHEEKNIRVYCKDEDKAEKILEIFKEAIKDAEEGSSVPKRSRLEQDNGEDLLENPIVMEHD